MTKSDAEYESAQAFAERLVIERDRTKHHWVLGARRVAVAAYLVAGRDEGKQDEAQAEEARRLLQLPDEALVEKLQASSCVSAKMEGWKLRALRAQERISILMEVRAALKR